MNIEEVKYVFFIGIGGIGMSALARYFKHRGCHVSGYDRTETTLTRSLRTEGILVFYEDDIAQLPSEFAEPGQDGRLVIYTPAIPADLTLFTALRAAGYPMKKRSEVLGAISQGHYTIAVAGTHGKTTTSCLVAHILIDSGYGCSAFLGGISANYQTNTLFGSNKVLVVEADEYDRSFLTLHPDIAILTSADADHLDIYGDHAQMMDSFGQFLAQVSADGIRIVNAGLPFPAECTYSAEPSASLATDVAATHIRVQDGSFYFDYQGTDTVIETIRLGIPGRHNIENAVAAITAALQLGIDPEKIKAALANFAGVKRRFEYHVRQPRVYIDDYAHHPTEIRAFLSAVRELYPDRSMTLVFQPHLFSRTRDFLDEFADALGLADTLILMEIYPAREQPIPGIDARALLSRVALDDKHVMETRAILDYVEQQKPELLLTVGAGDIDRLTGPLTERMSHG